MHNYPEWSLLLGAGSIGAVVVGVNAWWVAEELSNEDARRVIDHDDIQLASFLKSGELCPYAGGRYAG